MISRSCGSLSERSPRQRGARNRPSVVQFRNSTSPTSFGLTQRAPLARSLGTSLTNGDVLRSLAPRNCYVEVHPADAQRLGLANHQTARITSRRGSIEAQVLVTSTVQAGQIFIPMHYPEVNRLTNPSFDPHSRQPSYKHCAVKLEALQTTEKAAGADEESSSRLRRLARIFAQGV